MSPLINYSRILNRLKSLRRRLVMLNLGAGLLAAFAYLASGFLVAAALSLSGFAPVGVRALWWVAIFVGTGIILGPVIWKNILFPPSPEKLALVVEADHPTLKNRLIASLQLHPYLEANVHGYSPNLVQLTLQQADDLSADIDMAASANTSSLKSWSWRAGTMIVLAIAMVFFFPGAVGRALSSFSKPLTTLAKPVTYDLTVYPGNAEVVKFDTLAVRAVVVGSNLPDKITFSHQAEGGHWISEDLDGLAFASSASLAGPDSVVFMYRLGPLMRDVLYTFATPQMNSPVFVVQALDRPRVIGMRLEYFYPAYTGREPLVIDENDGAISALAGTDVDVTVRANKTLATAELILDDEKVIPMTVRDRSATGRLKITRDASYHIRLVDGQGYENPHPIEYPIGRLEDAYPRVEILLPGHDADLNDQMAVNLKVAAVDDFGFSGMWLNYRWLSGGQVRDERRIQLSLPEANGTAVEVDFWWDLEPIGMMPSDVVSYHVEISDNDLVSGPKSSVSKTYSLRFPSLDEMIAEVAYRQEENIMDLEEILQGERMMAEELERLHREMLKADEIDWQSQKQMDELNQRRQELTDQFAEAAEDFAENTAEMQDKKMASAEMLAKLAEAQQLFQEVATEEMKEAARLLAEAMKNLDPQEVADAMENMEVSTEEMIERLERTIAYLKKLQAEQKLDQMIKRAEDILNRQEQLNEKVDASGQEELPPQAEKQDGLKEDFNQFADDLEALEESLNEAKIAPPALTELFCEAGKKCNAPQSMNDASQAMQQQNKPGAQQSGKQAADELREMVAKMQNLQQVMTADMQSEVEAMLRDALDKAMYLSEHQEDLLSSTGQLDPQSPNLRDLAEMQADLRAGTDRLIAAMEEIAKKSMCVGGKAGGGLEGVRQGMDRAAEMLTQQNGRGAAREQQEAMFGLNQTAQQLLDGMEKNSGQCQNPGSCNKPGGMPRMESLSSQQGRLNMQMQQLEDQMGQTMSAGERMALSRLKAEQEAVKKGIDELQSEFGNQRNVLGRLDKLSNEMKKVIEDMEHYEVSHNTIDRMQRIYSRMLDFQHSLHRQDFKEDRRARTAEDFARTPPPEFDFDAGLTDSELHRLLEQYLEEGYPKAYEELIKSYYRQLLEDRQLQSKPLE